MIPERRTLWTLLSKQVYVAVLSALAGIFMFPARALVPAANRAGPQRQAKGNVAMSRLPLRPMERAESEWFADEDFWAALSPLLFPEASFTAAWKQVGQILTLVGGSPSSALDLACGPGRHAVPLAQRGLTVTGADHSLVLLDQAHAYAGRENVNVEWVAADMHRFVRPGAFDLALNIWSSFGYFEHPQKNQEVFENVHTNLKAGGVFVLDLASKEVVARTIQPIGCREVPGAGLLVERWQVSDGWGRLNLEWIVIKDGRARPFFLRFWLYSGQELKTMLTQAGFAEVQIYGSLDGSPYGPEADRLIAVARRA